MPTPALSARRWSPRVLGPRNWSLTAGGDPSDDELVEALASFFVPAMEAGRRASARYAAASAVLMAAEVTRAREAAKKRRRCEVFAMAAMEMPVAAPPPGAAPPALFPSRLHRARALPGDPSARRKAEDSERGRWAARLADFVSEAGLPLAALAETAAVPGAVLSRVAQGRRAGTLRRRARDWDKARRFFTLSMGRPWPRGPADFLEFVAAL